TETPRQADLEVTKTVDNSAATVGMVVTFTALIRNNGPDPATRVVLGDPLPPGLAFVGASPSQGSYDPATGLWFVGTLAPGAAATLAIDAPVPLPPPLVNSAAVAHSDQFDPDLSNNSSPAAVSPPSLPDLLPTIVGKVDLLGSNLLGGTPDLLADALFING